MAKVEQKQVVVNEIKEKLEKAASVVMVDARGLTVEQDTALRKQLRDAGVDYKVYKNTMMHFAIQGTEFEGLDEYLAGPSAFAFSYEDATAGASILNKVAKDVKELEFKAGVVEGSPNCWAASNPPCPLSHALSIRSQRKTQQQSNFRKIRTAFRHEAGLPAGGAEHWTDAAV